MNDTIIDALNWRYAVKDFDPSKQVTDADLHTILDSARLAPSSVGIEPWKFIVVDNADVRAKLRVAAYDQAKVTHASHLIVVARRTDVRENIATEAVERTAKTQGKTVEDLAGLKQMLDGGIGMRSDEQLASWVAAQTYIALGMMIETASLLKIDNCPMEGFDAAQVNEILGLNDKHLTAQSMLAVGYRGEDPYAALPKTRRSFEEVVEFVK